MEKRARMWLKALLVIAGLMLFCFMAGRREPGIDYEKEARLKQYEADESIEKIQTMLLAYGDLIKEGADGQQSAVVLTTDGMYTYESEEVETALYRQVTAYIREDTILEVVERGTQEEITLSNLWVSEVEEARILCFMSGVSFYVPFRTEAENREQVADIVLKDGAVDCRFKKEKTTGKLLRVTDTTISLSGKEFPLAQEVKAYRLYGDLQEIALRDLPIGYENTDYVLEDGKICACLVSSEENMETIRVLLQSGNYGGRYHDQVALSADCGYTLQYGEKVQEYADGESVVIAPESPWFAETERIVVSLSANTGKMLLQSIQRARERTDYRGSLEIIKTGEGLVVINELLLEEYLYAVVPSEMPASYPPESLKAQAVCARTYAYRNMEKAGLPELGAHVDDSTAFQVYGNTTEKAETTAAVKATKGELLLYGNEPVDAYYYSTSCGYGTDTRAWNGADSETVPYLCARAISGSAAESSQGEQEEAGDAPKAAKEGGYPTPEEMRQEAVFAQFIAQGQPDYFESGEAWYRWKYIVDEIDIGEMERRLADRYALQPQFILTETDDAGYVSQSVGKIGVLRELDIVERNAGGNAAGLRIEGSEGTYLVQTEYNIRYILNNGQHPVIRGDGSESASPMLLPSAFLVITTGKENGDVIGYSISGGGYGHGIGMSQNGAKNMALAGMTQEQILSFFYEGSRLEKMY